jgi:hypothetical protein
MRLARALLRGRDGERAQPAPLRRAEPREHLDQERRRLARALQRARGYLALSSGTACICTRVNSW